MIIIIESDICSPHLYGSRPRWHRVRRNAMVVGRPNCQPQAASVVRRRIWRSAELQRQPVAARHIRIGGQRGRGLQRSRRGSGKIRELRRLRRSGCPNVGRGARWEAEPDSAAPGERGVRVHPAGAGQRRQPDGGLDRKSIRAEDELWRQPVLSRDTRPGRWRERKQDRSQPALRRGHPARGQCSVWRANRNRARRARRSGVAPVRA